MHTLPRPLFGMLVALTAAFPNLSKAQIDPEKRQLVQAGYSQPFEGHAPLGGYAFYHLNQPEFYRPNLTLRLIASPVYAEGELGIKDVLPNTDVGIGLGGGGFIYSHNEVRGGLFVQRESFLGHGAEVTANLYHTFNPGSKIPLTGILRARIQHVIYDEDDDTSKAFAIPDDQTIFIFRSGVRWGGQEPLLMPNAAFELSAWYEGHLRSDGGSYGFGGDRKIEDHAHLFWVRALLAYTLPELKHHFQVTLNAGASLNPDRISAFKLGAFLPLIAEYPLTMPGYYFEELSAKHFAQIAGQYSIPIDPGHNWHVFALASTALVDYTPGMSQPGNWNSSVGGGIFFRSPTGMWQVMTGYARGIDAIRNGERGANSVFILFQVDLEARGRARAGDRPSGGSALARMLQ